MRTRATTGQTRDEAERVAVAALAFLAGDAERLGPFLAETGLSPDRLRLAAGDPGFLPAVLDYLITHENLLVEFATESDLDPGSIIPLRNALPGPRQEF